MVIVVHSSEWYFTDTFPFLVAKELIFRLNDINVPEEMVGRVKRFFFLEKIRVARSFVAKFIKGKS